MEYSAVIQIHFVEFVNHATVLANSRVKKDSIVEDKFIQWVEISPISSVVIGQTFFEKRDNRLKI